MPRLIDADAFENYVFDEWQRNEISNSDWMTFREWLRDQETVDAVQVIRCKDCKHKPSGTGANHDLEFPDSVCPCQCEDYWYSWKPKDDWFCGNGERKEE